MSPDAPIGTITLFAILIPEPKFKLEALGGGEDGLDVGYTVKNPPCWVVFVAVTFSTTAVALDGIESRDPPLPLPLTFTCKVCPPVKVELGEVLH